VLYQLPSVIVSPLNVGTRKYSEIVFNKYFYSSEEDKNQPLGQHQQQRKSNWPSYNTTWDKTGYRLSDDGQLHSASTITALSFSEESSSDGVILYESHTPMYQIDYHQNKNEEPQLVSCVSHTITGQDTRSVRGHSSKPITTTNNNIIAMQ
jgi:hypothetical protein